MNQRPSIIDVSGLTPEDARRARLLNIMLAVVAAAAVLMTVAVLILDPKGLILSPEEARALRLGLVLVAVGTVLAYGLNRYVSGDLASALFLLLLIAVTAVSDEPRQVTDGRALIAFAIPILAASVLLRPWASLVVAGLSSLVIAVISITVVGIMPNVIAMFGFFVFAVVAYLSARSLEQALKALRASNEELQESEVRLEEMVEERTQELRDAQEQLVRREKLAVLGQLAGGVGHELRNPLGVISNAAYYLKMVHPDDADTTKEYLDMISAEVHNADRIISGLLDFGRTQPADRQRIAVSQLVAGVLGKRPPPEGVQVATQIADDLPPAYVDPHQIELVLANLVTNAYQAMPD
jgi:signal transduction histidine kinase